MTEQHLALRRKLAFFAAVLAVLIAQLSLIAKLIYLHYRPGTRRDFAWIYMAGRAWLRGESPYDLNVLAQLRRAALQDWGGPPPIFWHDGDVLPPYVYPPHWAVVAIPVALLPLRVATGLWDFVSYVSFVGVCVACWRFSLRRDPLLSRPLLLTAAALAAVSSGVRWSFGDCQMDIVPLLAVTGAIAAHHAKAAHWLALCTFLALLKPQIGLPVVLYLFLRGGARGVTLGVLAVGVVSLLAMAPSGLAKVPAQVLNSMHVHANLDFNAPKSFVNVAALLSPLSKGTWPATASAMLGIAFVVLLARGKWFATSKALADPLWQLAILMAVSIAFFPQHGYGFAVYTPVIMLTVQVRPRWLGACLALVAASASHATLHEPLPNWPLVGPLICLSVLASLLAVMERSVRPQQQPELEAPPSASAYGAPDLQ